MRHHRFKKHLLTSHAIRNIICAGMTAGCFMLIPSAARTEDRTINGPMQDTVMHDLSPWMEQYANTEDLQLDPALLTVADIKSLKKKTNKQTTESVPSAITSPLEEMYSARIVDSLEQFGYNLFSENKIQNGSTSTNNAMIGAVQNDYVLGIGDELNIIIRGQKLSESTYHIQSNGMLVIDSLPPIAAAGKTIGELQDIVKAQTSSLYNTEIFISLSAIKQIGILVVGHVKNPGRQNLSSFDTALDALMAAGGIEKTGTLRQIKLIRDGRTQIIDLYGLLVHGSNAIDISLKDGDKIIVSPIGPTIAVAGAVKRPAIYEILPALQGMWHQPEKKSQKLALNDLLDMAGGTLSPAQHRFMKMEITPEGKEAILTVADPFNRIFGDGAILNVARGMETRSGTIELVGHTRQAGIHALDEAPSLSSLLQDETVLGPDIYPLIGVIERWNKHEMAKNLIPFSPQMVIQGDFDLSLQDNDAVHLFSNKQISALGVDTSAPAPIEAGSTDPANSGDDISSISDPLIRTFLRERSTFVRGAVRKPGPYPVTEGATLETILNVAGGITLEGSKNNIEVTSAQQGEGHQSNGRSGTKRDIYDLTTTQGGTIPLSAGDTIRINQKFRKVEDNHVVIIGEVKNPGNYDLMPGDTLGKLLERTGGITEQGYPDGVIFSRETERRREQARFKAQAQDLELKLAAMLETQDKDQQPKPEELASAKDLITQLKNAEALGRITVEADPGVLKSNPEQDILLETGDKIYIPKRPLTVRVAGEVLSPASLQFRSEKSAHDYINEAGGYSYNADKDRSFIIYPDGSAQPLAISAWTHTAIMIPPGSTIIIPRDPKPFNFIDSAKDLSQILANLATTAIFADNFGDDD